MTNVKYKTNIKLILKSKKGFTIVELMVAVLLMTMVAFMAYNLIFVSGNFLLENTKRADDQNQSRIIFEAMQKEVGTAASVQIIGTSNPSGIVFPADSTGYKAYFVDNNVFSVMDDSKVIRPAFGSIKLKSLNVSYEYIDTETLRISIYTNTNFSLETIIFSRNVNIGRNPNTLTSGNVLLLKSAI